MRIAIMLAALCVLAAVALAADEQPKPGKFVVKQVDNPVYRSNEIFMACEDLHSPRCQEWRKRYKLDEALAGKTDEWERILALRHWVKTHMQIENKHPTPVRGEEFAIMDSALAGGKFHCGQFCVVLNATLNSCGYLTRRVYCGPGTADKGAHATDETWVNRLSKWVMVDAKYDQHFEKDGVPLSALEIRDEVLKDGAKSVKRVVPEGTDLKAPEYSEPFGPDPDCYRFVAWDVNTNRFTSFPAAPCSTYWVWSDKFWKENTWYYEGSKHWAYGPGLFIGVENRDWLEWTPNTINSSVKVDGRQGQIELASFTPGFKTYQLKAGDGQWTDCTDRLSLPLENKPNSFVFRAVNLADVTGPEHRVEIDWQGQ